MNFNLNGLSNIMGVDRIVSFFPGATELLYELGVGDKIFGVTHECLYPEDAKSKPHIISSVFDNVFILKMQNQNPTLSVLFLIQILCQVEKSTIRL